MAQKSVGTEVFVSAAALYARGWTPTMIRDLLGPPDRQARNPHYKNAAPIQLFDPPRVAAAEQTAAFAEARDKRARQAATAEAVAARRRAKLLAAAEKMVVTIDPMPLDPLYQRALAVWEADLEQPVDNPDDRAFRDRLAVNYARHWLTNYNRALDEAASKPGAEAARQSIRRKVYDAIAAQWPPLADECQRQLARRHG